MNTCFAMQPLLLAHAAWDPLSPKEKEKPFFTHNKHNFLKEKITCFMGNLYKQVPRNNKNLINEYEISSIPAPDGY